MSTEAIFYYKSALTPQNNGHIQGPIRKLMLNNEVYHYFINDGVTISAKDYWHHLGDLPIPKSFRLLDYVFENGSLKSENHIMLSQAYNTAPSKFALNIRNESAIKVTYELNVDQFQPLVAPGTGNVFGWDYKTEPEEGSMIPLSCGSKCREALFYGLNSYQLVVFYCEETVVNDRYYYIPCLGKTTCNTQELADVVFYNATREELITNWLPYFHGNSIEDQPGIADELTGTIPIRQFGSGADLVMIECTSDPTKLFYKGFCRPQHVRCGS